MTDERPGRGSVIEKSPETEALGAGGTAGVTLLRIVASLAVPVKSPLCRCGSPSNSFATPEANRLVLAIVAIVVGVIGVFAAVLGDGPRRQPASGPVRRGGATLRIRWSCARDPDRVPGLSGHQHRHHRLPGRPKSRPLSDLTTTVRVHR